MASTKSSKSLSSKFQWKSSFGDFTTKQQCFVCEKELSFIKKNTYEFRDNILLCKICDSSCDANKRSPQDEKTSFHKKKLQLQLEEEEKNAIIPVSRKLISKYIWESDRNREQWIQIFEKDEDLYRRFMKACEQAGYGEKANVRIRYCLDIEDYAFFPNSDDTRHWCVLSSDDPIKQSY